MHSLSPIYEDGFVGDISLSGSKLEGGPPIPHMWDKYNKENISLYGDDYYKSILLFRDASESGSALH